MASCLSMLYSTVRMKLNNQNFKLLDFLRHCRRFSFHERDFRPSLLRLRKSSLLVCRCYYFQTQYFLVCCQLVPCCCTTHYRGNLLQLLLPRQLQHGVPSTLPLRFDFGSSARTACACRSAAQSFSLQLFSRLLNFVYCSSVVFVHNCEGPAKILSCSSWGAWRSKI